LRKRGPISQPLGDKFQTLLGFQFISFSLELAIKGVKMLSIGM